MNIKVHLNYEQIVNIPGHMVKVMLKVAFCKNMSENGPGKPLVYWVSERYRRNGMSPTRALTLQFLYLYGLSLRGRNGMSPTRALTLL